MLFGLAGAKVDKKTELPNFCRDFILKDKWNICQVLFW